MKRLLLLIGIACSTALVAEPLRVMSFNVRYPNPGDGEDVWEKRRDLLVATIRRERPDVFGTQELFFIQGEYIVSKLPGYGWFGVSRRGNREDEHMGVFYSKERLRVVESGNYWLSETPEKPGSSSWNMSLPRMVTWGLFALQPGGGRFYFLNTHYPHRGEDGEARRQCSLVIKKRVEALPRGIPIVMTGDFNTDLDTPPYKVFEDLLQDAWKLAPAKAGPRGTFHGFKGGASRNDRIDWILFRAPWKVIEAATVTFESGGRYPSDHYPVTAVFDVR
jgi:endonuclease/exonuclease/phosphatase family metal-dependent hydrolase